jgi:hypothetical protein
MPTPVGTFQQDISRFVKTITMANALSDYAQQRLCINDGREDHTWPAPMITWKLPMPQVIVPKKDINYECEDHTWPAPMITWKIGQCPIRWYIPTDRTDWPKQAWRPTPSYGSMANASTEKRVCVNEDVSALAYAPASIPANSQHNVDVKMTHGAFREEAEGHRNW